MTNQMMQPRCEKCGLLRDEHDDPSEFVPLGGKPAELPPSKDMSRHDALRILGGWAKWSSPNEPDAELRAAARAVLHDRLALIRQIEEMRVAAATAAQERAENEPRKDHCEVCANPLPPVSAWSMPSCPDCQDLLEGLGQLMADFVDREQTIKADWIGRAINLLCARASQPPGELPAFKVGDRVIPTIAPHAKGDIRVRDVQTVYRISVDGTLMEAPYSERELVPYSTSTKSGEQA